MIRVRVDNRVRVRGLLPDDASAMRAEFTHDNPKHASLRAMGFWPGKHEPATILTYDDRTPGEISVPRGGMRRVRELLDGKGLDWECEDDRHEGDPDLRGQIGGHSVELWRHQQEAVEAAMAMENCIVRAPTGSGKTTIATALIARANLGSLVVVNTTGLLEQWQRRVRAELGIEPAVYKGKRREIGSVTIAMQQTLAQGVPDEVAQAFGLVLFDECQLSAARTYVQVIDPFPARYRFGISADERRKDGKEFLTRDLFGEVAADIGLDDVERSGAVVDVEVRIVPTEFRADWYGLPGQRGFEGDATDEEEEKALDFTRLTGEMALDVERNAQIVDLVQREVAAGERVLVVAHRREHCTTIVRDLVARGIRAGFLIGGEDYRKEFRETVAGLSSGDTMVGVGTFKSVGQAIDLPEVGCGVVASPATANRQVLNQVRGRVCRGNAGKKRAARLYVLWDRHVFGEHHVQNVLRWNRTVVGWDQGAWVEGREFLRRVRAVAA